MAGIVINLDEEPLDDLYDLYELIQMWDDESCIRLYGFTAHKLSEILQKREKLEKSSS